MGIATDGEVRVLGLNRLQGLREISMFTGAGGGVLAARLLGWTTVQYVEWDAYAQSVLQARIKDGFLHDAPIHDDVSTFDGTPLRGKVDVVSAGFPCFVAGTMVLTIDGYRPIEDLAVGDLVLTHLGRWRQVTSTMVREDAPLHTIKAQGVPEIVCSDEHPFYTRKYNRVYANRVSVRADGDPEWTPARDVGTSMYLGQVLPSEEADTHSIPFWWLVGRYLADGWRVDHLNRPDGNGRVVICANKQEATDLRARIKDAGFAATPSDERTAIKFHITNSPLYRFLEQFGKYAHGKRLPGWVLGLPTDKARALLDGYSSGDGYREKNRKSGRCCTRITTVSKSLALGMALLAQRAYGVVASIRIVEVPRTKIIEGRTVNQRNFYVVTVPDHNRSAYVEGDYGWKKVRSNTPCGTGVVFNISVDEDESYVADGAIVHNCQPFSLAGKQGANTDERNRWPDTIRVIRDVRPKYAFLENVPGLLTGGHGYFGTVLGDLATSGYDATWSCLPASAVGAPHRRDRLWILATRDD